MYERAIQPGQLVAYSRSFLNLFKKLSPWPKEWEPREQLWRDLERLASGAPHVLADIGFERDLKAGSPERTVWRRGPLCVVICTATLSVSLYRN